MHLSSKFDIKSIELFGKKYLCGVTAYRIETYKHDVTVLVLFLIVYVSCLDTKKLSIHDIFGLNK